ncbi:CpaF family protein [Alkaliphilus sp. B6464]|uniref:CpaF family protein n=1 Tax=Alkaliphilus sp. B6464 TaxID=2731219 RepID=UPI001BA9B286|nr:CpaF family protein [Alkaliphilus sp. B6464]QUH22025.1 CpaF family protein [Alkaliphilus sp. B6464]
MSDYLLSKLNQSNTQQNPSAQQNGINIPNQTGYMAGNNFSQQIPINSNEQTVSGSGTSKYEIKKRVNKELNEIMANQQGEPDDNFLKTTLITLISRYNISEIMKQDLVMEIFNDIRGYGVLEQFLHDQDVTEIIVNRYDNIWVEKFGKMIKTNAQFNSEEELRNLIDKIVQPLGRRIDDNQPMVNARLVDKSRVNAVIPPIAADGATLDIRKFAKKVFTIDDYLSFGTMTKEMADFIRWSVAVRKNIIVSGGTGSGKTTLLNFLSNYIPENEAIVTIEDLLELQLVQPNVRRLEARGKNAEGTGAITIRDCVINALRMRPDRIVVGECRSFEVVDMLQAMNTGHDGSLTTVHANNTKDMIERLYVMYLMGGLDVPEKAVKSQIASAIHLVVQTQRLSDGTRRITQISEIVGFGKSGVDKNNEWVEKMGLDNKFYIKNVNNSEVYLQDIFRFDGIKNKFVVTGWVPTYFEEIQAKGYPVNIEMFKGGE